MVQMTRSLEVDGVVWEVFANWRELDGLETVILTVTNTVTGEVFQSPSPTFKYIVARVEIAGLMKTISQTEEQLKLALDRARTAEQNESTRFTRHSDILTRGLLPWKLDMHQVYKEVDNQTLLSLWGIGLGKQKPNASLVTGTLPETWSVVLRGSSWLGHAPKACLQDAKGNVRGYFDPNWDTTSLILVPAVKITSWSGLQGSDSISVFFLDKKKEEWSMSSNQCDTTRKEQVSLEAETFADRQFPLRHDPAAYW